MSMRTNSTSGATYLWGTNPLDSQASALAALDGFVAARSCRCVCEALTVPAFYLVLPAYNPGQVVRRMVKQASGHADHVVIVDDGCCSSQREVLRQCAGGNVEVLSHTGNLGKGFALHTGIRHCLASMQEGDWILTMDSDGQHDPNDIQKFKALASNENVHFVVGERLDTAKVPFKSRIGHLVSTALFRIQFGTKIKDTQTGMRLLSKRFAEMVIDTISPGRFEFEMDMLVLAARRLPRIHAVEINTIYFDGNKGSKFRPLLDSYRVLSVFFKYGMVSIVSFLIDYLLFVALSYLVGIPYLAANAMARVVSAIANFAGHKQISFRSRGQVIRKASKYVLAVFNALLMASVSLHVAVEYLSIPEYLAKPMADSLVFVINFYVLNRLVFVNRRERI